MSAVEALKRCAAILGEVEDSDEAAVWCGAIARHIIRRPFARLCVHLAIGLLVLAGRMTGDETLLSTARFLRL